MTSSRGRFGRRSAATLLAAGAATIAMDQRMSDVTADVGRDALAQDWRAIGGDLRAAMGQVKREPKAA